MRGNDFLQFNSLVYTVYDTTDFEQMKIQVLKGVNTLVPCTCSSFLMTVKEDAGYCLADPVCIPSRYIEVEERYLTLADNDYSKWTFCETEIMLLRATDLLADEERLNHVLYQECFVPFQLRYAVYANLVYHDRPVGLLSLYREEALGDFTEDNILLLKALARHLSLRFYREKAQQSAPGRHNETSASMLNFAAEHNLTNRELEVFLALSPNLIDRQLAEQLCISQYTVKKHIQNLYSKTDAKRRLSLIHLRDSLL